MVLYQDHPFHHRCWRCLRRLHSLPIQGQVAQILSRWENSCKPRAKVVLRTTEGDQVDEIHTSLCLDSIVWTSLNLLYMFWVGERLVRRTQAGEHRRMLLTGKKIHLSFCCVMCCVRFVYELCLWRFKRCWQRKSMQADIRSHKWISLQMQASLKKTYGYR